MHLQHQIFRTTRTHANEQQTVPSLRTIALRQRIDFLFIRVCVDPGGSWLSSVAYCTTSVCGDGLVKVVAFPHITADLNLTIRVV